MENKLAKELCITAFTKDGARRKISLLKEFFSDYYFKQENEKPHKEALADFLHKQGIPEFIKNDMLSFSEDALSVCSATTYTTILDDIQKIVDNSPLLTMYVATILPPTEVAKLGQWMRANVNENVYIDINVDRNVVGGCSFAWNGVYHDYSLRYYFEKNRTEMKTLLRNYNHD